jgi:hypothetical protein
MKAKFHRIILNVGLKEETLEEIRKNLEAEEEAKDMWVIILTLILSKATINLIKGSTNLPTTEGVM